MQGKYLIILDIPARRFYERVISPGERHRVDEILNYIAVEPYVDNERKAAFPFPPANALIYADDEFWAIYENPEPGTVVILNIGYRREAPSPEREEPYL